MRSKRSVPVRRGAAERAIRIGFSSERGEMTPRLHHRSLASSPRVTRVSFAGARSYSGSKRRVTTRTNRFRSVNGTTSSMKQDDYIYETIRREKEAYTTLLPHSITVKDLI